MTYRVDQMCAASYETTWHSTWLGALAHERVLTMRGARAVAWDQSDHTGPWIADGAA